MSMARAPRWCACRRDGFEPAWARSADTSATKLVADADGRVIGVEAVQKKNPVRIKANKGVVMATGSFAGSTAMIGQMNAECANLLPGSNPGATGDGLVMAMELGAYTTRLGHAADEPVTGL